MKRFAAVMAGLTLLSSAAFAGDEVKTENDQVTTHNGRKVENKVTSDTKVSNEANGRTKETKDVVREHDGKHDRKTETKETTVKNRRGQVIEHNEKTENK